VNIAADATDRLIDSLLDEWETAREAGIERTPEELCRDTPHLLAILRRKIEALSAFDSFVQSTRGESTHPGAFEPPTNRLPSVAGYELFDELGRGGMGVVYRARQIALNRIVAIKMILGGDFAGSAARERFHREAEAIARLQHPNIVQVHEFGTADGLPYAALEFVGGGTLAKRLTRRPIPPADAAALVETLARAVQQAHEHGVVHRDLKPGNVLLADDRTLDSPKISDFGLAKLLDGSGGNQTGSGDVFGTPGYMSPEQARGDSHAVGPVSDTYALGAILYECLTGRPPFEGENLIDILSQVTIREPISPRALLGTTPPDLETICLKCLEKEPAKRYSSAAALADDLGRYRRGEPVLARPIGRLGKLARWTKRNPTVATLAATATLGLLATATVSTAFAVQSSRDAERLREALDESRVRLAESHAARGRSLAEGGDVDLGLLWFARAIRALPPDHADLDAKFREEYGGWEQNHRPLRAILNHEEDPFVVLANPQSRRCLVVSSKSARLWNLEALAPIGEPLVHGPVIYDAKLSPDGSRVALAGDSGGNALVSFWDARTGERLPGVGTDPFGRVAALDWSPNGQVIAAGLLDPVGGERKLVAWNVANGDVLGPPCVIDGDFASIRFSPDSTRVHAFENVENGFGGGRLLEIDFRVGKVVGKAFPISPRGPGMAVPHALTMTDDGRAAWTVNGYRARKWDLSNGALLDGFPLSQPTPAIALRSDGPGFWVVEGSAAQQRSAISGRSNGPKLRHGGTIASIATDGGSVLVTAAQDRTARIWGQSPVPSVRHDGPVKFVAASPDGRFALSAADAGAAVLWNLATDPPTTHPLDHVGALRSAAFSSDGSRLVGCAGTGARFLYQWRTEDGTPLASPIDLGGYIPAIRFAPNGRQFLTAANVSTPPLYFVRVQLWDAQSGQSVGPSIATEPGFVQAAGFAASGARLLVLIRRTKGEGFAIGEWDAATGQATGPYSAVGFRSNILIGDVVVAASGQWIAAPAPEGGVLVWDRESKTGRTVTGAFADPVAAISATADGHFLFAGSADGAYGVYEVATGRIVLRGRGHTHGVKAGLFPTDSNRLLTASEDGSVRQWDLETGAAVAAPFLHPDGVFAAAVTPDGTGVLTGCQDGIARLWRRRTNVRGSPEELQRRAEKATGFALEDDGAIRALSAEEWNRKYFERR